MTKQGNRRSSSRRSGAQTVFSEAKSQPVSKAKPSTKNLPSPHQSGDEVRIAIERLTYNGGRGVGRSLGLVVFVAGVVPGETVRVRIERVHKRYAEATLIAVESSSPQRRPPRCRHYADCGGCTWQHLDEVSQREQKMAIVAHALRSVVSFQSFRLHPILPSPLDWAYRSRVRVHQGANGELGFFKRNSHSIVKIDHCEVATTGVNAQLLRKQELAKGGMKWTPGQLWLHENPDLENGFTQINDLGNKVLQNQVKAWVHEGEFKPRQIMDLYGGDGNLSRPLLEAFSSAQSIVVEENQGCVNRGIVLAKLLGKQISFERGSVEEYLQKPSLGLVDLILVNPPRSGMGEEVVAALGRLAPQRLIYISCNPMTFARDAARLAKVSELNLTDVQPIDLFPQTEHVELVSLWKGPKQ